MTNIVTGEELVKLFLANGQGFIEGEHYRTLLLAHSGVDLDQWEVLRIGQVTQAEDTVLSCWDGQFKPVNGFRSFTICATAALHFRPRPVSADSLQPSTELPKCKSGHKYEGSKCKTCEVFWGPFA